MRRVRAFSDEPSFSEAIYVGIGEIKTGYSGEFLKISSLGSCIGLVIYPTIARISKRCAIMAHIMLSQTPKLYEDKSKNHKNKRKWGPAKYANEAVPRMISKLEKLGYKRKDFIAKMVGGAKMFNGNSGLLEIGKHNIDAAKRLLKTNEIPLKKYYTGGEKGMSVHFSVREYVLVITPSGELPIIL